MKKTWRRKSCVRLPLNILSSGTHIGEEKDDNSFLFLQLYLERWMRIAQNDTLGLTGSISILFRLKNAVSLAPWKHRFVSSRSEAHCTSTIIWIEKYEHLGVLTWPDLTWPDRSAGSQNSWKIDALGYRLTVLRPHGQVDKRYGQIVWLPFPYHIMSHGGGGGGGVATETGRGYWDPNGKPDTDRHPYTSHGFQKKFRTGRDESPAKEHIRRYNYDRFCSIALQDKVVGYKNLLFQKRLERILLPHPSLTFQ